MRNKLFILQTLLLIISNLLLSSCGIYTTDVFDAITIKTDACIRCQQTPGVQKVAVIVEPREHPLLIPIALNVISHLPDEWVVQIFHGTNNENFIRGSVLAEHIRSGKIILSRMNIDNLSLSRYNSQILLNPYFWQEVVAENVLTVETDAALCSNAHHSIEKFEQYDYVGAPWYKPFSCRIYKEKGTNWPRYVVKDDDTQTYIGNNLELVGTFATRIGNSGLSFKKKSKMIQMLQNYIPVTILYKARASDLFIGCAAQDPESEMHLPTVDVAKMFSIEDIMYEAPFGVHKTWSYFSSAKLDTLAETCVELNTILKPHYASKQGWGK